MPCSSASAAVTGSARALLAEELIETGDVGSQLTCEGVEKARGLGRAEHAIEERKPQHRAVEVADDGVARDRVGEPGPQRGGSGVGEREHLPWTQRRRRLHGAADGAPRLEPPQRGVDAAGRVAEVQHRRVLEDLPQGIARLRLVVQEPEQRAFEQRKPGGSVGRRGMVRHIIVQRVLLCKGAEEQRSRGAEEQRSRGTAGAGEQGSRGTGEERIRRARPSAAPSRLKARPSREQEKQTQTPVAPDHSAVRRAVCVAALKGATSCLLSLLRCSALRCSAPRR